MTIGVLARTTGWLAVLALAGVLARSSEPLPVQLIAVMGVSHQSYAGSQIESALLERLKSREARRALVRLSWVAEHPPGAVGSQPIPSVIVALTQDAINDARTLHPQVPMVFATFMDPVTRGLVRTLHRPGRHITGVSLHDTLDAKRLEWLMAAIPALRRVHVLADASWMAEMPQRTQMAQLAQATGVALSYHVAESTSELDQVMRLTSPARDEAWYIPATTLSYYSSDAIIAHLKRQGAYAIFSTQKEVERGGLMALVQDTSFVYDALASLTLRVLNGEDPGTIPIERPKRYLLVVRTGKGAARTPIAPAVLRRADVVIGD